MQRCPRAKKVLDYIVHVFFPPKDDIDWVIIPWQPLLFVSCWISAIIMLIWGDFTNIPYETADQVTGAGGVWVWLSLVCPVLALGSLHLIRFTKGKRRYCGFWLRLAADMGQGAALTVYTVARFMDGDHHLYTMALLTACMVFVGMLVYRDSRTLIRTEKLANKLIREEDRHGL